MSGRLVTIYVCVALLAFAAVSHTATARKSPTYDEPTHALASYVALRHGDFRAEPEHPPLWKYWAAVPRVLIGRPVDADLDSHTFRGLTRRPWDVQRWIVPALFRTPGNDARAVIGAMRVVMLAGTVALGAVIALLGWRLGGGVAAAVAATLFTMDPNFLGHGSLMKNDTAIALCFTALAYALLRAGRGLTVWRIIGVALLCAAAVTTKLTGLLAGPIVAGVLFARALMPEPWATAGGRMLTTRAGRLGASAVVCAACVIVTYVSIWAVYRFRYEPSADPGVRFDVPGMVALTARMETANLVAREGLSQEGRQEALHRWSPGPMVAATLFALEHRLVPEAFGYGIIYANAAAQRRGAYLLGENYAGSRWYYFPVAFVTKTPMATLVAVVACPVVLLLTRRRAGTGWQLTFGSVVVAVPVVLFLLTALTADLNLGLRHIFPLYPFLYVLVGIAAARLYAARRRVAVGVGAVLMVGLAVESIAAYPHYIPFFNVAAGGTRGGVHILGDSNLDWGQDLPLLAEWQRRNPHRTLHLAYFGTADPAYYGIRYRNAPDGYEYGDEPPAETLPTSGVLAVSASVIQSVGDPRPGHTIYRPFRRREPTEVLGGSIYLFDLGGD